MLWAPTAKDEVLKAADPLFTVTGAPRLVVPSLNCTVPVGVPEPGGTTETVAVKVTGWPNTEGFADDDMFVELCA